MNMNDIIFNITNFDYISFATKFFSWLTFESFLKLIVIYFFIVWIAIIIWVTKDIINRTNNILLQIFSILTVLVWTPLWIVIYLLIRPSKTLFEKYYEEASVIEEDLSIAEKQHEIEKINCPSCDYEINSEYKFCPNCRVCLKKSCISCNKDINPNWSCCPYCWKNQEEKVENILNNNSNNVEMKQEKLESSNNDEIEISDEKN